MVGWPDGPVVVTVDNILLPEEKLSGGGLNEAGWRLDADEDVGIVMLVNENGGSRLEEAEFVADGVTV